MLSTGSRCDPGLNPNQLRRGMNAFRGSGHFRRRGQKPQQRARPKPWFYSSLKDRNKMKKPYQSELVMTVLYEPAKKRQELQEKNFSCLKKSIAKQAYRW
jgi:hypothetical protein